MAKRNDRAGFVAVIHLETGAEALVPPDAVQHYARTGWEVADGGTAKSDDPRLWDDGPGETSPADFEQNVTHQVQES